MSLQDIAFAVLHSEGTGVSAVGGEDKPETGALVVTVPARVWFRY